MFEVTAPSSSIDDTDDATMHYGPGESKLTSKSQSSSGASRKLSAGTCYTNFRTSKRCDRISLILKRSVVGWWMVNFEAKLTETNHDYINYRFSPGKSAQAGGDE